jgi:hypothetical protein
MIIELDRERETNPVNTVNIVCLSKMQDYLIFQRLTLKPTKI